ncbi:MAG: glycosyltransferase family 39 protein [Myxococcales bacterium]|nr:glycosyltransferase family 39 protein [Myxococcales bacterium]
MPVQPLRLSVPLTADPAHIPLFSPGKRDFWLRWGTILGVYALYIFNCGSFGLWDPWEVHYGEVTRGMVESYDWVNPWWGYKTQIGTEPRGGNWFYSKPIWIFWSEASFVKLIGLSDWAFRLPMAIIGASAVSMTLLTVERILDLRRAMLVTAVMGLSPFIYMVSRQAQTDMPFVATLTIALCFSALAFFSKREALTDRKFLMRVGLFVGFVLANLIPQWSIIATDLVDANASAGQSGAAAWARIIQLNGIYHVLIYAPIGLAVLASVLWPIFKRRGGGWDDAFKDRTLRTGYWLCFYMMAAQATYAKGLLGFMLPGAILFIWLLVTSQWRTLSKVELLRGLPLFFVTVLPWYVAMFCRHGMAYYNRFFVHDHFNRVGSGVHQIDQGTFEHFIKWLGFGLFPWTIFAPIALVAYARLRPKNGALPAVDMAPDAEALSPRAFAYRTFLLCWFVVAFALFTASSTKFHHYILPAVPALTALVGLYLADLRFQPATLRRVQVLLALGFGVGLVINLLGDVQHLRNLFTYKYDRPLPQNLPLDWDGQLSWRSDANPILHWRDTQFAKHVGGFTAHLLSISWLRFETFVPFIGGLTGLGVVGLLFARARKAGLALMTVSAALMAFWALNYYMPMLSPSWSQKYLFESYYEDCNLHPNPQAVEEAYTPWIEKAGFDGLVSFFGSEHKRVCKEDIVSWLITWRGETFYSNNEIRPITKEAKQFEPYLREFNKGRAFYVLMERGRTHGFRGKLNRASSKLSGQKAEGWAKIKDWNVELINNESAYFVVGRCTPNLIAAAAR